MKDKNNNSLVPKDYVKISGPTQVGNVLVGRVVETDSRIDTVLVRYRHHLYSISEIFLEKMTDGEAALYILEHANDK